MKTFQIKGNDLSDGYHTFDELYEHRCLLFLNLCFSEGSKCYWKPHYEGWFVLYFESPFGQISYHIPDKYLPIAEKYFTRDDEHKWDGHTSDEVLARLMARLA